MSVEITDERRIAEMRESNIRTINELRDEVAALRLLLAMGARDRTRPPVRSDNATVAAWPQNVRVWA